MNSSRATLLYIRSLDGVLKSEIIFFFFYVDVIISAVHLNLVRVDCDGERTTRQSVE
jgi:NADH:ubiquinone oxidoreductase subunit K